MLVGGKGVSRLWLDVEPGSWTETCGSYCWFRSFLFLRSRPFHSRRRPRKQLAPFQELADEVYFEQTGHHVSDAFLDYWWYRGGLDMFGFPLTEATEINGILTQYFERAHFEYHPNNPDNFKVLLGLLGNEVTQGRKDPAFNRFPADLQYQTNKDRIYFPQTGHFLSYGFKTYWQNNGGLPIFGYPISEEFSEKNSADGKTYTVQYFERACFEYHPEHRRTRYEVQLGRLGREIAEGKGVNFSPVSQQAGTPDLAYRDEESRQVDRGDPVDSTDADRVGGQYPHLHHVHFSRCRRAPDADRDV
jgi:hypothetical protein